jgi:hypothetical protein
MWVWKTHQLLDNRLDEGSEVETLMRLAVPNVLAKHSDRLSIGIGAEGVPSLEEDDLELLVYVYPSAATLVSEVRSAETQQVHTVCDDTICKEGCT